MHREFYQTFLPLIAGIAAILSGLLPLQIAGGVVIMAALLWPLLRLGGRPEAIDRATATGEAEKKTGGESDDQRATRRHTPRPNPR